ncbi:hypothetical protein W97_03291 [Coniosporium apollinis CBS 100218]|uniref:Synaptobrevin n=1 Tax=Coniosporium apollinis (strain CBS 100218) TaxID=1168221 RepID=R7YQZ3_CONA1|nr:uncharacterized protein W97_03291 [Coniosporium apollinis CBS 100218]EON64061.1 hypothetical protein W97_03291 [Coniosporium apollinis CBS 100218]
MSVPDSGSQDVTVINLRRLLSRLEQTLLSPDADPYLRKSLPERTRVGANLDYARSLLLRLEHDSANIKIQSRKQALQTELQQKRDLIKQLNQRLQELAQLDDDSIDEDSDFSEADDAAPSYAPAQNVSSSIDTEHAAAPGNPALQQAAVNVTSMLRSRFPKPDDPPQDTGASTSSSLFPAQPKNTANGADTDLKERETLLSHDRNEQEVLTESLLQMTQALKQQAVETGSFLEIEDKEVVAGATSGLEKNASGLEAASTRMGALRRMTEGRGLWGRLMMYAWIAGLWLLAFIVVFILPKLRF